MLTTLDSGSGCIGHSGGDGLGTAVVNATDEAHRQQLSVPLTMEGGAEGLPKPLGRFLSVDVHWGGKLNCTTRCRSMLPLVPPPISQFAPTNYYLWRGKETQRHIPIAASKGEALSGDQLENKCTRGE